MAHRPSPRRGESAAGAAQQQVEAMRNELQLLQADIARQLAAAKADKQKALEQLRRDRQARRPGADDRQHHPALPAPPKHALGV